ncbi:hypothetical protein Q8A67_018626 [Cirrhinus molitorella]|uniref:Uncharacterized protein n=1 Tax=Cirrhinus molitorella TaxID=172907 RepID=A0AA88PNX2_9TELE|nr:hypothetical protein Q8A67_018626 [Cirrhinus molitorella]
MIELQPDLNAQPILHVIKAETVRSLKQTPQPATVCSQSNTLDPRKSDQLSSLPLDHEARAPPVEKLSTNVQVNQYGNADQPDPPTGPETEDPQPQAVSSEPIVDILDKMMSELQVLKQAAVSKSRPLVAHTQSPRIVKDGPSTAKTSKPLPDLSSQQDFQSQPPPRTSSAYNSEQHKSYHQGEPATTSQPYLPMRAYPRTVIDPRPQILPPSEPSYRGPMPSIPYFSRRDPSFFVESLPIKRIWSGQYHKPELNKQLRMDTCPQRQELKSLRLQQEQDHAPLMCSPKYCHTEDSSVHLSAREAEKWQKRRDAGEKYICMF